jgi:hypothetical protein
MIFFNTSYGPPSPPAKVEATALPDNKSQDEIAVIIASNIEIFVLGFRLIHLIQLFYFKFKAKYLNS